MSEQSALSSPAGAEIGQAARPWHRLGEDWTAVVVGFVLISAVLFAFQLKVVDLRNLVPSFRWTTDSQIQRSVPGWNAALDAVSENARVAGQQPVLDAARTLKDALGSGDRAAIASAAGRLAAFGSRTLAGALGAEIQGHAAALAGPRVFSTDNLSRVLAAGAVIVVLSCLGVALMAGPVARIALAVPAVFLLAWLARFAAGNGTFIDWGIEYVIFALVIGLLISNTVGVPGWLRPAVQTEFFIKTGLVTLGASLLFMEVLQAGALGIVQGVLVVFVVWYACFWLCRKLRVDDEFAAMLSTAVSICGVSAAIAACGAIQGDKKKLSYVTSIVLVVAVPMMIAMPWIAKSTGMNELVAGAWLGGTLDTSASVVAAGALISDAAMKTGVIVKFSQNALIGVAALALAIWWTFRSGRSGQGTPGARVIWERFPKFVIGFAIASLVFSFLLSDGVVAGTRGALGELRLWLFAMAFLCIGLETRFIELLSTDGGRPALAFISAQAINVAWTLVLAYLLFGGVLFAQPDIR